MTTKIYKTTKVSRDMFTKPEVKMQDPVVPLSAKEGFLFGCDPELFVFDNKGKAVSAAGLIPGTKHEPYKVEDGAVQVDGMAAEFNTNPVSTFEEFDYNITNVLRQLKAMLPEGYTLRALPSITFDHKTFDAAPDEAKELGCSPDFNAWTGEINPPPHDPGNPYMRTAAGHLHIGWTKDADFSDLQHLLNCRDLVKQLDWYLGGWSLKHDSDPVRRGLYGKAGACRYKSYGVEYRVLSNFWVLDSTLRLQVWNRMMRAIEDMRSTYYPDASKSHVKALVNSINTSEPNSALEQIYQYPLQTISSEFHGKVR